ncbi:unnamed protein product [Paramecium sonneborni]|uniref:C2H2-type domain-containing protein n=1 Tax=Paramecium sonneborni TaxID=65129 RepID=A0A8S1RDB9_9CILI|nr:unnamed protein product [Paramecium sonneborni]
MGDYHFQYLQQYLHNVNLRKKVKELLKEKTEIQQKLEILERDDNHSLEERKKRLRSLASEVQRNFECPLTKCNKKYGSEGSLNQHIKLKHPELVNKT